MLGGVARLGPPSQQLNGYTTASRFVPTKSLLWAVLSFLLSVLVLAVFAILFVAWIILNAIASFD